MTKPEDFKKQGSLHRVGLSNGIYEPVDLGKVKEVLGSWEIEDTKGLLDKVTAPSSMGITDHALLLQVLIGKGYKNADDKFAVGPVLDQDLKPLPNKMRIVHYESVRQ